MKNFFSLKNKFVIVTGAAGLLAEQHIDVVLSNQGNLVLIDVNLKKLKKIKKKFNSLYSNQILIFKGDVSNESNIRYILSLLKRKKIKPNVLINNAAVDYKLDSKHKKKQTKLMLENFSSEIWKKDLDVSLLGSLNCIKIFGSEMVKNGGGVILNIASDLAFIAPDNRIYNSGKNIKIVKPISYSVVKHGIVGLTKYVAVYWAKKKN